MGYYTHYELSIEGEDALSLIELFREEYEDAAYALEEDGSCRESIKWYDAEKHLCEFSKNFPNVLFTLYGEGKEAGDIWKLYVRNGKSQLAKAKLTIADFDPSLLTDPDE